LYCRPAEHQYAAVIVASGSVDVVVGQLTVADMVVGLVDASITVPYCVVGAPGSVTVAYGVVVPPPPPSP
jgi:hypothetical protein